MLQPGGTPGYRRQPPVGAIAGSLSSDRAGVANGQASDNDRGAQVLAPVAH